MKRILVLYNLLGIFLLLTLSLSSIYNKAMAQDDSTVQAKTLDAFIKPRLTLTAHAQQTIVASQTLAGLESATFFVSPTITPSRPNSAPANTASPSPTPLDIPTALLGLAEQSMTRTAQVQDNQTATAVAQGTFAEYLRFSQTATAAVIQASVSKGFQPITTGNVANLKEILTLKGHTDRVTGVAFSPSGLHVASASLDHTVRIWDTLAGYELLELTGWTDRLTMAFSPDGSRLVAGSSDQTIRVWDGNTFAELPVLKGHTDSVLATGFNPDGTLLASAGKDKTVRVWVVRTGASTLLKGHRADVQSLVFARDGQRLITGGADHFIIIWEAQSAVQLQTLVEHQDVLALAASPNGILFASGGTAGLVQLWDIDTGNKGLTLSGQVSWITSLAFCPDGSCLASGNRDGSIWIFDVKTGQRIIKFQAHSGGVESLAFSPEGTRLASAGNDKLVRIWAVPAS